MTQQQLVATDARHIQSKAAEKLSISPTLFLRADMKVEDIEPEDRERASSEARLILDANRPATDKYRKEIIWRVLNHYDAYDKRSAESKAGLIADWSESLMEWPADLLHRAAKAWREQEDNAFMPTVGKFIASLPAFRLDRLRLTYVARKVSEQPWFR